MHECRIYIARVSIVIFHVVEASAAFEIVSVAVCACLRFYVSDLHANTSCERITQWSTHASAASSQYAFAKRKTCNVPFKQRVEGNYSRLLCIRHSTVFAIAKAGKSGITSHYPNQQCEARSIINFSTDLLLSRATMMKICSTAVNMMPYMRLNFMFAFRYCDEYYYESV